MRSASIAAAVLALCAVAAAQPAAQTVSVEEGYRQIAVQIAPGVHVLHQAEPFQPGPVGNVTVIEQSDGLVLVDSGGSRGDGERAVALIRGISRKPVKAVLVTHWHNDHPLGLSAIRDAWPRAEIIATRKTRDDMAAGRLRGLPFAANARWDAERTKANADAAAEYRANAAKAESSAAERQGWADLALLAERFASDDPGTHVVLPTRVFETRHVIPDAERPVELRFLGRANTDGDAVAWLPKQRILAAGDIVVSPVPYGFNVYPADWIAVLTKIKALKPAVLVPGHGLPQRDMEYVDVLLASMAGLRVQAAGLKDSDVKPPEAAQRMNLAMQRRAFGGQDAWRLYWLDRYWLTPFAASALREVRGEALGPPPLPPAFEERH